jgi:hypothetical protein
MRPSRTLLAAATLLGLASCSYSFRNPVEDLAPGEVGGRTVAGTSVVLDGVAISVKGGELDSTSRANGRFALLPLPVGRHTLVFRKGTDRALQRVVDINLGKDAQPQGVWLGDVELPAAVALQGEVAIPGVPLGADGVVVDETSGATAAVIPAGNAGTFLLTGLAVGAHRIRVSATGTDGKAYVAGPLPVTFSRADAGAVKTLARMPLRPPTGTPAPVTVRVAVVGSVPGVSLTDFSVIVSAAGATTAAAQALPVGADGVVQVQLPEGPWSVRLAVPASATGVTPPNPVSFVAVAGATVDLGTLYAVTAAAHQRAELACHTDPDCAPSGTCSGGVCGNWTPPPTASASVPYCDASLLRGGTCQPGLYGTPPPYRACVQQGAALGVVACGSCCTPDGVATLCAKPGGVEGCPAGHAVLGLVTGAPAGGVEVTLSGTSDTGGLVQLAATTAAGGLYVFDPVQDGTYFVSPFLTGYVFAPSSRTVRVGGADVMVGRFAATSTTGGTGSISGRVTGAVASGVQIMALPRSAGLESFATTDPNGNFTISGLAPDTYDVYAYLTGYTFSPVTQTVAVTTGPVTLADFVATQNAAQGTISGTITGVSGQEAIVKIVGSSNRAIVATVNGNFSMPAMATGETYTITPELTGVSFSPPQRSVYLTGNAAGQDFTATSTGVGGTVCSATGFCWRNPLPSGQDVQSIWGSGPNDVWFVGAYGTMHWDGATWTGSPGLTGLQGVHGTSATDVWAVGGANIEHWNGTAWSAYLPAGSPSLRAVWADTPTNAWAVGASGAALNWNGNAWLPITTSIPDDLAAVWGTAANDVWAGGSSGTLAHWDGAGWSTLTNPTGQAISGVWGSAPNDYWAVGPFQQILHFDGATWTTVASGTSSVLYRVWGTASNDVWAGGLGSEMAHWDGVSWTTVDTGSTQGFFWALWGSSPADVWASSMIGLTSMHGLMHWDGTRWLDRSSGPLSDVVAVWGSSPTDVWAVRNDVDFNTAVYQRWNGTSWTSGMVMGWPAHALWGASSTDAWAVGDAGHIVHWTGSGWGAPVASPVTATLRSVQGSSSSDVWAVGDGGTIAHWDGSLWTSVHSGVVGNLAGVWAAASNDAWAVGVDDLGSQGQVLHWDGTSWTTTAIPTTLYPLVGVWGSGSGDVWALSQIDALHYVGGTWTQVTMPGALYLAISGSGPNAVWAVGSSGTISRFDGTGWTALDLGTAAVWPLYAVWAAGNGDVWAAGMQGTILRYP